MEQYSQYLMWVKSKNIMNSFSHSWEEQAFAEDALGPLGGFIWPPRSYSCSFCGREFRSAQALGGHMNVHRRERAKLKQSLNSNSSPQSEETIDPHHHNPSQSQNPSFYPSSLSPSMVSVPLLAQETFCSISDTKSSISDEQVVATGHDNTVETNLFVGLTLDFSGNYSNRVGREDGEIVCCKKQKIGVMLPMSSMEEIDLELRLGDLPTVKQKPPQLAYYDYNDKRN